MTQSVSKVAEKIAGYKLLKSLFVASVLASAVGAASAYTSTGETTNENIVVVGGSTLSGFHGPVGAPGVGFIDEATGDPQFIISLQSISLSAFQTGTPANESGFTRYYLPGYSHTGSGGTINAKFNWAQVPTGTTGKQVYFGLVSASSTVASENGTAAFYVGDRDGYAVPSTATNYTTVALLTTPTDTTGASPTVLQGTLALTPGVSLAGNLTNTSGGTTNTLNINATPNISAGTFAGSSSYNGITGGTSSGQFYGSGSSSAIGGVASGTGYVASFGGVKQ